MDAYNILLRYIFYQAARNIQLRTTRKRLLIKIIMYNSALEFDGLFHKYFWSSRLFFVFGAIAYIASLNMALVVYLEPTWDYYGFAYVAPGFATIVFQMILVGAVLMFAPLVIDRPSKIIYTPLLLIVFIPSVVICLAQPDGLNEYGVNLSFLALAFVFASLATRFEHKKIRSVLSDALPNNVFMRSFAIAWVVMGGILVVYYGSIMQFVGETDIYEQREVGASLNIWLGYVQTYYTSVICVALFSLGLMRKKFGYIALGIIGSVIVYMIDAQRTPLLMPLLIWLAHKAINSRIEFFRSSAFVCFCVTVAVIACLVFQNNSIFFDEMTKYIVHRTIALPGLTFAQYTDVFGQSGYTLWSHVKGVGLIVDPPDAYQHLQSWPKLGNIVGDLIYSNPTWNVNANLFSGDGIAAAGGIGVLVIGGIFALYLIALDRASQNWNRELSMLFCVPLGITLTNGHFFTFLLSFGGGFWLLCFYLYKPSAEPNQEK